MAVLTTSLLCKHKYFPCSGVINILSSQKKFNKISYFSKKKKINVIEIKKVVLSLSVSDRTQCEPILLCDSNSICAIPITMQLRVSVLWILSVCVS